MNVYGIFLTPEEIRQRQIYTKDYIKALIEAERLNPDTDYDGDEQLKLLKRIAISDLPWPDRTDLVSLLFGSENDEE